MIYVRHPHRDSWHWYRNCSSVRWSSGKPKPVGSNLKQMELPEGSRPKGGELCSQCLAKERNGTGEPIA